MGCGGGAWGCRAYLSILHAVALLAALAQRAAVIADDRTVSEVGYVSEGGGSGMPPSLRIGRHP